MLSRRAFGVLMLGIGAAIWPAFALASWIFFNHKPFQD